ncbi:MAG: tRNA pseudouridine(55) synthase TruB [Nanoarchaeota archaeon]
MVRFNPTMQVLSKKDQKPIIELMESTWGVKWDKILGFGNVANEELVMLLSQKEKIYLGTRGMERVPLSDIRINTIGCYFGEYKGGDLRLSIEGAQMIGPSATKNIVELDRSETEQWMKGEMVVKETGLSGFVLIKHGKDFIGCGKITGDGRILNFVPKTRRITAGSLPSRPGE